ncbi:MAG: hypothetical protein AAF400_01720 [Bacteroidota bacterium]
MYKNTKGHLFLFSILILSLATGCGGWGKKPPAPKDSHAPKGDGEEAVPAPKDSHAPKGDGEEAVPAPKDSHAPEGDGEEAVPAPKDSHVPKGGGETGHVGSPKAYPVDGYYSSSDDTLAKSTVLDRSSEGDGEAGEEKGDSDGEEAVPAPKDSHAPEGDGETGEEKGDSDGEEAVPAPKDSHVPKGGGETGHVGSPKAYPVDGHYSSSDDTLAKSTVLDRSSEFISAWKKIGESKKNTPPAVKMLFHKDNGILRLYERGKKLWDTIKASVQEVEGLRSEIIARVDELIAAATELTSKKPEELSEEFIEKLVGRGVDLATIPVGTQEAISAVRERLEEVSKPAEASEENPAQPGEQQKQWAKEMIKYLDLLEQFIPDTPVSPST